MRKSLFGILALSLSALSLSAALDLTAPTADLTNVFEKTQTGALSVTGNVKSLAVAPTIKYAIFASADAGIADRETVLNLSDFIVSQDETKSGFLSVNKKVYVKRILNNIAIADLDSTSERVSFKIKTDPTWTASETEWLSSGVKKDIHPFKFTSKTALASALASTAARIDDTTGDVYFNSGTYWEVYFQKQHVGFNHVSNGVLEVGTERYAGLDNPVLNPLGEQVIALIENHFANGQPFGTTQILAKLD